MEELAVAAEFFPALPTTIPVVEGATNSIKPSSEASESPTVPQRDPEASKEVPVGGEPPKPSLKSEKAPESITGSQKGLLLKHSARVPNLDRKALENHLDRPIAEGGLTKKGASGRSGM